jgi:hypothetical protein
MRTSKAALTFKKKTGISLENFAEAVKAGLFGNILVFLVIPITSVALQLLITDYSNARLAYESGGKAQLPQYQKTMKALKNALIELAPYVDTIALGDIAIINMAGFEATYDPKNAKGGIIVEEGLTMHRPVKGTGTLISECSTYPSGTTFLGFLFEGSMKMDNITVVDSKMVSIYTSSPLKMILGPTKQNTKVWTGLTPGVTYYCYYIVITSKGISTFSNLAKMMCG